MSAPHVAGLAAPGAAEHPTWSPARLKSAMMTTAYDLAGTASPFAQGAGHVDPGDLLDPGLVLDAGHRDYLRFLSGQGFTYSDGSPVAPRGVDAGRLNLPSIAVGALVGTTRVVARRHQRVRRTRDLQPRGSPGSAASTPRSGRGRWRCGPGRPVASRSPSGSRTAPSVGSFAKGGLTWTGLTHQVRLPVVVRPEAVEVPGRGDRLPRRPARSRWTAPRAAPRPSRSRSAAWWARSPPAVSLQPGRFDPQAPRADADTAAVPLTVPAGTEAVRVQLERPPRRRRHGRLPVPRRGPRRLATGKSPDETLTLVEPPAGDYTAYVVSASAANGTTTTGQLYTWVCRRRTPATSWAPGRSPRRPASPRVPADLDRRASPTSRWFGVVRYGDSDRRTLRQQPALRPSRRADSSRISTLRILPVTVIGNSSTTST